MLVRDDLPDLLDQPHHRVHGVHALFGVRRMAAHTPGFDHDLRAPPLADFDARRGRLADNDEVRMDALCDFPRRDALKALLMHRAGDADRTREVLLCLRGEAPCRHDHRTVAALHVGRAPAVDLPVRNLAAERVVRPLGRINHVHGVHVPVEQNRFAGPFSVNGSDDVSEPVKDYLVKAECEHSLPHQLRHGLFLTGNARGLERSLAKGDQRFICIHAMAPFCLTKKASPRRGSPIFYSSFFFKYATVSFRHPRIARSQCSRIRSLARGAFSARSASTIPMCCAAEASRIAGRWK